MHDQPLPLDMCMCCNPGIKNHSTKIWPEEVIRIQVEEGIIFFLSIVKNIIYIYFLIIHLKECGCK